MAPGADYEMQGMRYQDGVSQDFVATSVGAAAAMDAQRGMRQREVSLYLELCVLCGNDHFGSYCRKKRHKWLGNVTAMTKILTS